MFVAVLLMPVNH